MAIVFRIKEMERTVADGGVFNIHWIGYKIDGTHSASSYGATSVTPDPQSETFIPYVNLTENDVIGWLKTALGEDYLTALEARFDKEIAEQKAPKTASGIPWQ